MLQIFYCFQNSAMVLHECICFFCVEITGNEIRKDSIKF